jgi:hypothetical protein
VALVQKDLVPGRGDQLLTLDTATGLEWLNLTVTANHSYLDVLAGFGGFLGVFGFRYATSTEVGTLYIHAGIGKLSGPHPAINEANHYGIEVLQDLMNGKKMQPVPNSTVVIRTAGMVALGGSGAPSPLVPIEVRQTHLNHAAHEASYTDAGGMTQRAGARSPEVGSYLVLEKVGRPIKGSGRRRR